MNEKIDVMRDYVEGEAERLVDCYMRDSWQQVRETYPDNATIDMEWMDKIMKRAFAGAELAVKHAILETIRVGMESVREEYENMDT